MSEVQEKDAAMQEKIIDDDTFYVPQNKPFAWMKDFVEPQVLHDQLMDSIRKYHPSEDVSIVEKAYQVAKEAHGGQNRKSGEPYIIHPLNVAIILAELEMDKETIVAGLLHDVVEDTIMTVDEIAEQFGEEVALLVDGVTKLGALSYDSDKVEVQAENLRKMFLAMAKDIRVIIIKLADRLHNMRTLQYMSEEKQREKARETMAISSPIAQRLGISRIKVELDDLALKYLDPDAYYDLVAQIDQKKTEREEYVASLAEDISRLLKRSGIKATVVGRAKHFFSIYKKMKNQGKDLDAIYDLFAIRIIVEDLKDCYAALGAIHEKYTPIPGRFKDYIAIPKPNMYQSLHSTLIGPEGRPFEIQIRTEEMHRTAEFGIAAHWKYKEDSYGNAIGGEEEKLTWLRQILEWQQGEEDNQEFLSLLKTDLDLFSDSVFCFTPEGDVKTLPAGSTAIDFAYSIHSAVGNHMTGAKVNGKLVPINYVIHNGDQIEILTSANSKGPSRDWLNIVKSPQARSKINQWFRHEYKDENIQQGKELLQSYCKTKGVDPAGLGDPGFQEQVQKKYGLRDWNSVLASVGYGGLSEPQIVNRLLDWQRQEAAKAARTDEQITESLGENRGRTARESHDAKHSGIVVKGLTDVAVHFAKCCSPVPGDDIIGFVTRGRGVSIHRTDCTNILDLPSYERDRLIDAEWQQDAEDADDVQERYLAEIKIYANNRTGLLVDISRIFSERGIDIVTINSRTSKRNIATITVSFKTRGTDELSYMADKLRQVDGVFDIERTTS